MGDAMIKVELSGFDTVEERLKALENPAAVQAALEAIATRIAEIAQVYVETPGGPVIDPGRNTHALMESIHVEEISISEEGGEAVIVAGGGGETPGLALWLEYGTGVYGEAGRPIRPLALQGTGFQRVSLGEVRKAQMAAFGYYAAPMLHWQWSWGDWASAFEVAGQPPRQYMHRTIEENMDELVNLFRDTLISELGVEGA